MMVDIVSLDDPISQDGLDAPEELWFGLSLGVAIHRYFLHVDDALTADFALDFSKRRDIFTSAKHTLGAEREAALVKRIAQAFGVGTAARLFDLDGWTVLALDPDRFDCDARFRLSDTLRRTSTTSHQGIVGLGAMSVVAVPSFVPRPSWTRLLGIVCVPSDLRAAEAASALFGQVVENIYFAFLYAGLREGYVPGNRNGAVEEITDSLMHEHGEALARVNQLGAGLLDRSRHAVAQDRLRAGGAPCTDAIDYMPLTDFLNTMTESRTYLDRYLRGLGTGQS